MLGVSNYGERSAPNLTCMFTETVGILTECTVTTNVSRALNLEFDWETFSKTLHIMSADN